MRFSKYTLPPFPTEALSLEALTGLAIITPIITAIFYALPGEGGGGKGDEEETENEEICEFNLWLHCHEQN